MRRVFLLLLLLGLGLAPGLPLRAQLISPEEESEKEDRDKSVVIPHRYLLDDPMLDNSAMEGATQPVLEQEDYIDFNIPISPQLALDRAFNDVPYPYVYPFNPVTPEVGQSRLKRVGWDVEPRAGASWGYDDNLQNSATDRLRSPIFTASGGVMARIGALRPDLLTGLYQTKYSIIVDYDVSHDSYIDHPELNSLNQQFRLQTRLGRDTFVLTPFATLADVTSRPLLDVDRQGLVRRKSAEGGIGLDWTFGQISYRGNVSAATAQQGDPSNFDYDRLVSRHEVGWNMNRTSRPYLYTQYLAQLPSIGSAGNELENGVGFEFSDNDIIVGRVRWRGQIGWAETNYQDNPLLINDSSGVRYHAECGEYFTANWEWILSGNRAHYFDDSVPNSGRVEDEASITVYWRPTERLGVGLAYSGVLAHPDNDDQDVVLHRVQGQVNYAPIYNLIFFSRATYEHSSTDLVDSRDVVSFRESVGVEYRY